MFEPVLMPFRERIASAGVVRLGIFGSVARGEARADSDVDVFVGFRPDARTYDNLSLVSELLEEAFHRKVDLVTEDSVSPYLMPHIIQEVQYVDLRR